MIHPPQAAADTPSPGRKRERRERLMNPGMRQEGPQRKGQGKGQEKLDETDRLRSPLLSPTSLQAALRVGGQVSEASKAAASILRESPTRCFSLMTG